MTVHLEQNVKRERKNQQDATILCLLLTSVSTCFGHHYAHNDARNMLRQKLIINIELLHLVGFFLSLPECVFVVP